MSLLESPFRLQFISNCEPFSMEDLQSNLRRQNDGGIHVFTASLEEKKEPISEMASFLSSLLKAPLRSKKEKDRHFNTTDSLTRLKRQGKAMIGMMSEDDRQYLREEIQKTLDEVVFLRNWNKMNSSSHGPLDFLTSRLRELLGVVEHS